jgi:hypothetical protein
LDYFIKIITQITPVSNFSREYGKKFYATVQSRHCERSEAIQKTGNGMDSGIKPE